MAQPSHDDKQLVLDIMSTEFGVKNTEISPQPLANNTKVYTVTLDDKQSKYLAGKQPSQLPGVVPIPPGVNKLIVRITDPGAMLNNTVLVQNEVASMSLARQATVSLDIAVVPQVYAWKPAVADKPGWMVIEYMYGETLNGNNLTPENKKIVLSEVATVFKLLQQYEVPSSLKGYGGLGFADDGSIITGPTTIFGATKQCESYHELYRQYLQTQLAFMDKCDIVCGWKDTNLRQRIDRFVAEGFEPLLKRVVEANPRQTFVHGDFDTHNLLFDPKTFRLTALLDFNFSHIASAADEYFYSFALIDGLLPPPGENEDLRNSVLQGFSQPPGHAKWDAAILTDKVFAAAGVIRPVDLMPSIEPLSALYWFIQNISPGWFFMPKERARWTSDRLQQKRKQIHDDLGQNYLEPWGF
ncbi:hypothetical protein BX600DRAFT_493606 [Xylariales sp. PMI_506]|nr:hypothetical protein BX600DRAFT_493606 [Xylariales sp. PMI_506]